MPPSPTVVSPPIRDRQKLLGNGGGMLSEYRYERTTTFGKRAALEGEDSGFTGIDPAAAMAHEFCEMELVLTMDIGG